MSEPENYTSIFLSIRERLARAVSRIVPPKDIEDIVQETYVRLCQTEKNEDIHAPRAFLFKMARNLALDKVKRAESRLAIVSVEDNEEFGFGEPEDLIDETYAQVVSNEEFALFCEAVRQLPVKCRRVFVLKKVYGFSQREVAEKLNLSESTVEKHIAKGLKYCALFMVQQSDSNSFSAKASQLCSADLEVLP